MENFKQKLAHVRAFIFDVDGVLTDGSVILMPDGEQVRTMNIKDGYALQLAVRKGYKVAIISGGRSRWVEKRLQGLGIFDTYMGVDDKREAFSEFLHTYDIKREEILYMGDDMPDYLIMQQVGLPTCPADAVSDIKNISIYISSANGGKGCVRDVIEQTLRLHGRWYPEGDTESLPASR